MAGKERFLVRSRTKIGEQKFIDETNSRVEQRAVARRAVIGDRALQKMSDIVEFVTPLLRSGIHALRGVLANVVGVEIAVGFLRGDDLLSLALHKATQFRP